MCRAVYDNSAMPKSLNIVGTGRVGRTLARLWSAQGVFGVGDILTRGAHGTREVLAFIGAGRGVAALTEMRAAEVWMLTTPDDAIAGCGDALAQSGVLQAGDVVFHCSGALPSEVLASARARGAHMASVHPLKSFADPHAAAHTFAGTYCQAEGDAAALALLKPAFERIGAHVTEIDVRFKTLYHAASVLVCNDLTALMEAGLQCYEKAGLPRATASAMMEPLVRETMDNIFRLGATQALTGPIARGDVAVVTRQLDALREFDPRIADIYRALGAVAVDLARAQGGADAAALRAVETLLYKG